MYVPVRIKIDITSLPVYSISTHSFPQLMLICRNPFRLSLFISVMILIDAGQVGFGHSQGSFSPLCGMHKADTVAPRTAPYLRGICKIIFFPGYTVDRGGGNLTAAGEFALTSRSYVGWYVTV